MVKSLKLLFKQNKNHKIQISSCEDNCIWLSDLVSCDTNIDNIDCKFCYTLIHINNDIFICQIF